MERNSLLIFLLLFPRQRGRHETAFSHFYVEKLRIYNIYKKCGLSSQRKDIQFWWEWQKNCSNLKRKIQNLGNISNLIHTCDGTQNRDIYREMLILFLRTCFTSPKYVIFKWN